MFAKCSQYPISHSKSFTDITLNSNYVIFNTMIALKLNRERQQKKKVHINLKNSNTTIRTMVRSFTMRIIILDYFNFMI